MKLLTNPQKAKLLKNGADNLVHVMKDGKTEDFKPIVKLFTPDAQATWLITEIDPEDQDIAFGLADLGMGYPEIGAFSLSEIAALRGPLRLPVERDMYFTAKFGLNQYAENAKAAGRIVT